MKLPSTPETGRLYRVDDDEVLHVYSVESADYNSYEDNDDHWLTFYCRAERKLEPNQRMNPHPWVEVNLRSVSSFQDRLRAAEIFTTPAYDTKSDEWMTNVYYFSHHGLEETKVKIVAVTRENVTAEISGKCDCDPIILRAEFRLNPKCIRSIS